jgi:hypothetical protein
MTDTLLDMTQEVLSALSSDEVNSIGDTTESMHVATIIKRKTLDIWSRSQMPEREQLIQLVASNDTDFPVLMTAPDEADKIQWIKYFNSDDSDDTSPPGYQYVNIYPIQQFLDWTNRFDPNEDEIESFTFTNDLNDFPGNYTFYFKNNKQPECCTVISNKYVIFDSYDNELDDTLQTSKTMCLGQVRPVFYMEDTFSPQLSPAQYSLLINEAKALAFLELKQISHPKAEQEIQRQWSVLQKDKRIEGNSYFDQLPNYGRR